MCDVKLARLRTSADKPDNWIDLAGYAVCGESVTQRDDKPIADDPDTFVFKVGDRVRDALGEGIIINHTCNALTVAFDNGGYRVCTPGDLLFVSRPEPHDVIPVSRETMAAIVRGDALNQAAVFKVSDRVKHAKHGEGEVLSLYGHKVLGSCGKAQVF